MASIKRQPVRPASACAAANDGKKRRLCPPTAIRPRSDAIIANVRANAKDGAMGFSTKRCFPKLSASAPYSWCIWAEPKI